MVQFELNSFNNTLINLGYDPHFIVISDDSIGSAGICIPAPLGSGHCPLDENLPKYQHIAQTVGSGNALQLILDKYDLWKISLRSNSIRSIMVISDDDSDMSANDFITGLIALDNDFSHFQFHAIVAEPTPNPTDPFDPCYGATDLFAQAQGLTYMELSLLRDGIVYDLCTQDFAPAWPLIATQIDTLFRSGFE